MAMEGKATTSNAATRLEAIHLCRKAGAQLLPTNKQKEMYSSPTALYLSNAHIFLKRYYREDRSEGCLYILILLYTTLYTLLLFADTPSIALSKLST